MELFLLGIFILCNLANSSPTKGLPYAIGGVEVESIYWFPYQTAIYARYDSGPTFCSGAILSKKSVITCAHCLAGSNNASVFYGSQNLSALDFTQNQVIDKSNYRIHTGYSQYVDDVAIIIMNVGIEFNGKSRYLFCSVYLCLWNSFRLCTTVDTSKP